MVKTYLRYSDGGSFGVIASTASNAVYATLSSTGLNGSVAENGPSGTNSLTHTAIAPALEDVVGWNLKTGTKLFTWHDPENRAEVTCIAAATSLNSSDRTESPFAVGYSDGAVRLWLPGHVAPLVTFNGHRAAITALSFDSKATRLASGSADTDVIVWDIVSETGICRFRGHKNAITALRFVDFSEISSAQTIEESSTPKSSGEYLISTAKDSLMKVWDLSTKHCAETVIAHRNEVWSMDVLPGVGVESGLTSSDSSSLTVTILTASVDAEVKVWTFDPTQLPDIAPKPLEADEAQDAADDVPTTFQSVKLWSSFLRQSKDRCISLLSHRTLPYLGIQSADKSIELYRIRSLDEVEKTRARKKRRVREKEKKKGKKSSAPVDGDDAMDVDDAGANAPIRADEMFTLATVVRANAKVRSFDFEPNPSGSSPVKILVHLSNNVLEWYNVIPSAKEEPFELVSAIDHSGHRADVRSLALSSDDTVVLSGSNHGIKLWNAKTRECIRSIPSGYALCSAFVPGNKHALIGTKGGHLEIFDLTSSEMIESIEAHTGALWSLQVRPDKKGIVTGGADKDVKFWDFQLVEEEVDGKPTRRLTLVHMRTLRMADDVLSVRYSPDQRLIAVALLDSTVKIFYHDTLKFFLSLYGHKLPVLSMDISSDNSIIATASADKTIKVWGLDFGDCHKSFVAHSESVMNCQFVWGTHYLWSASKDGTVKEWDCDKYQQIQKHEGHRGEVWALAVGRYGNLIFTGSHDRSIRVLEKTDEQLFLEEERERELEDLYDTVNDDQRYNRAIGSLVPNEDGSLPVEEDNVAAPGKKTKETLKAGERMIEALDVYSEEREKELQHQKAVKANPTNPPPPPPRSPYIVATGDPDMSADRYVLRVFERIRQADLEEALLVLPLSKLPILIDVISRWVTKGWNSVLCSRILTYYSNTHFNQVTAMGSLRIPLETVRRKLRSNLEVHKTIVGFNLAAIRFALRDSDDFTGTKKQGKPRKRLVFI
ncbi:WD40 repeat-like protein [Gonapodya prolifera JEL478]|uniref:WD40 repeat-like protein n=1 Tax=Gonapodya prolifera (strain JEL478) TaxID=1344416 RepID=A0A139ABQ0_GONPJ|nr:WD40 repeat-like protein [Gonapodya prolifera JEL478]|eukprot:KXS14190.1 WD40 repeat-like protein [Gonapodya prolifera JEL478]